MKKNIYEIMKQKVIEDIMKLPLEVLGIEAVEQLDKASGELKQFVRVDVEIKKSRESGVYSRVQFSVKVDGTLALKVTPEQLETADFYVFFNNLNISYIDSRNNVYLKADSYDVEQIFENE